jgi:hypothetical protein
MIGKTMEKRHQHERPDGVSDGAVLAAGKMSEALETLERARGHLYSFHQLLGEADLALDEVIELLREQGAQARAEELERELVGRNVLAGRWTFQVVEEFDDAYWSVFRAQERALREALVGGRRHVYEAEMKARRRTDGHPAHTAQPDEVQRSGR